jgi:hypothetical protein
LFDQFDVGLFSVGLAFLSSSLRGPRGVQRGLELDDRGITRG